jgi:menaquinone-9 beta-reductase
VAGRVAEVATAVEPGETACGGVVREASVTHAVHIEHMPSRYDAVVIGAGPAGSTTAALLAARGCRVALVDRATFPRPKPCAEYLNPDAVGALERLGVLAAVEARAPARIRGMRIVAPCGADAVGRFGTTTGLALRREHLDLLLVEHAARRGAEVITGASVDRIGPPGPRGRMVEWRTGDGRAAVEARLVIGADGLNSRVARLLGGMRRGRPRRAALVAHYEGATGMRGLGEMFVTPLGYVGLAPLDGGVVNVSAVWNLARAPDVATEPAAWLAHQVAQAPEVAERLRGARRVGPLLGAGPFATRPAHVFTDQLLLVGDAAGFFDPFTGDGVWTALVGAEIAADIAGQALATGRLTARDLAPYQAARRRAFRAKWAVERLVSAVVGRPRLLDHVARRLAARPRLIDTLVGVTGHQVPATSLLAPALLWDALH